MKKTVIAVCGKGGAGKTTVSAVIARALSEKGGVRSLIVDADPTGGLAMALAIRPKKTLDDIREETIRQIRKGESSKKDLAMSIDFLLMEAVTERGNLAFLPIGRPEETGCYCSVNSLLRDAIELLAGQFDVTLIDAEAGVEQVNRQVMKSVDHLILVADTSAKGIRVAETILKVAGDMAGGIKAGLILNRFRSKDEAEALASATDVPVIGFVPEDDTIRRFDAEERSFFDLPSCPAADAVLAALGKAGITF